MDTVANDAEGSPSAVKTFQGFRPLSNVIETGGMTIDLEIDINATIESHNWHLIFALYGTPTNASLNDWIGMHKSYPDKLLIDRIFPFIEKRQFALACKVIIHISGREKLRLQVGSRVLRLQMKDIQKDALILNGANIVARTSDGMQYDDITVSCPDQ